MTTTNLIKFSSNLLSEMLPYKKYNFASAYLHKAHCIFCNLHFISLKEQVFYTYFFFIQC